MDDLFVLFPDLPWFPNRRTAQGVDEVRCKAARAKCGMERAVAERRLAAERFQKAFRARRGVGRRR